MLKRMLAHDLRTWDGEPHFTYVAGSGRFNVKIGYSKDPSKRIAGLQTGASQHVSLLAKHPNSPELARTLESCLHGYLDRFRRKGEWFFMPHHYAVAVAEAMYHRDHDECDDLMWKIEAWDVERKEAKAWRPLKDRPALTA